jgi:DNA-binding MarR family transcriptional regulator
MAESLGMSPVDNQVLHLLRLEDSSVTAGRLGELTHLPSSTTTRVIDRLDARGYVHRIRDTSDRRCVLIHPDEKKPASSKSVMRRKTATLRAALDGLSAAELEAAHRFLARLTRPDRPPVRVTT